MQKWDDLERHKAEGLARYEGERERSEVERIEAIVKQRLEIIEKDKIQASERQRMEAERERMEAY